MRIEEEFVWASDEEFKDIWKGQKGLVLGRGNSEEYKPSAKVNRFRRQPGTRIVGCNSSYKAVTPDALVWCDGMSFFVPHRDDLTKLKRGKLKDTILFGVNPQNYRLYGLRNKVYGIEARRPERCSEGFDYGFYPCNLSGFLALNIAILMGLDPIWLVGFLPKRSLSARNLNFIYISEWCERHNRSVYVADKDSSLRMFFDYRPLFKKTSENSRKE